MGGADYVHILFSEFMEFDPEEPQWPFRDRFFLDPGHMSAMLYSIQHLLGHYSTEDLMNFRQWGSATPGHPELDVDRGVENTSGPLGQGHTFGIGSAIAERFLSVRFGEVTEHKTYIYISDGGIQEEVSQGAGRIAGFLGLGNVIMFYDANDIQLSSEVSVVMDEDTARKYEAWGWHVQTIEGNNPDAIRVGRKAGIGRDPVQIEHLTQLRELAVRAHGQDQQAAIGAGEELAVGRDVRVQGAQRPGRAAGHQLVAGLVDQPGERGLLQAHAHMASPAGA